MSKDDEIKQLKRLLGQLVTIYLSNAGTKDAFVTCVTPTKGGVTHQLWQEAACLCRMKATNQWVEDPSDCCRLLDTWDNDNIVYATDILNELKRLEDLVESYKAKCNE